MKQPLQVDLVRGIADRAEREPLGEGVAIPAGISPPVRLPFVPNQLATDNGLPEKNSCSSGRFNSVIIEDGRIGPLVLEGGSPQLSIMSDRIEGTSRVKGESVAGH